MKEIIGNDNKQNRTVEDAWREYQTTTRFNHQALLIEIWKLSGGKDLRESNTVGVLGNEKQQ